MRGTASAKHCKGENEEHSKTGSVEGTGDQVRVVLEDAWTVVSEIKLDKEAADKLAEDDTSLALVVGDVASKLDELRHVDFGNVEATDLGYELFGSDVSFRYRRELQR